MEDNRQTIETLINYIEEHISEDISLKQLANIAGYSKYHVHRMFTSLVGFPLHHYIVRRKLTESARMLVFTEKEILQIALDAGYESQQAYTYAFKTFYKMTPQRFRRKHKFLPMQLKFDVSGSLTKLKGDRIVNIELAEKGELYFVGFKGNTRKGFLVIPRLWHKLQKEKSKISNRISTDFVIGINDYSKYAFSEDKQIAFDHYAAVEVDSLEKILSKMNSIMIPASKYVIFTYEGKASDSIQPVMDYIYKEWFLQSNCELNENARLDFVRYSEKLNEKGLNQIEVWIPIV